MKQFTARAKVCAMGIKHSIAQKKKWADVPAEVRFKRMSRTSKSRWDHVGAKERKKIARGLVNARRSKKIHAKG